MPPTDPPKQAEQASAPETPAPQVRQHQPPPDKRVDADTIYKLLREELTFEANLIVQRTSWFVASQAFFFTSLAIALDRSGKVPFALQNSVLFPIIPILSLVVCTTSFLSVLAGISTAQRVRTAILALPEDNSLAALFPQRHNLTVVGGLLPSFGLPIVFAGCWVAILSGWV